MSNLCWALEKKLFYCLSFFVLLFSLCGKLEKPSNNFLPVFLLLFIYLSIVIFHCFFVFVFFVHLSFDSRGISKLSLKKVVLAVETIRLNNLFLLSRRFCKTLKKKTICLVFELLFWFKSMTETSSNILSSDLVFFYYYYYSLSFYLSYPFFTYLKLVSKLFSWVVEKIK